MGACAKVYINDDYSVELFDYEIKDIVESVHESLYDKPRPKDYTVADILNEVKIYVSTFIERVMEDDSEDFCVDYCMSDLSNKQRTKEDYWQIIKLVLEQIEVIVK